jgi:hypothetical protein
MTDREKFEVTERIVSRWWRYSKNLIIVIGALWLALLIYSWF